MALLDSDRRPVWTLHCGAASAWDREVIASPIYRAGKARANVKIHHMLQWVNTGILAQEAEVCFLLAMQQLLCDVKNCRFTEWRSIGWS
jgi:hypothetical protein